MNNTTMVVEGFQLQPSTSILAVATVLGALLGAVLGYFGQRRANQNERDRERTRLRIALKTEMESMLLLEHWREQYSRDTGGPVTTIGSSEVYEASASRLGLLSDCEISAVVEFYTRLRILNEHIELSTRASLADGELIYTEGLIDQLEVLDPKWKTAIGELEKNLPPSHSSADETPPSGDDSGGPYSKRGEA